jgi:DHA2 family multidrug resistance protein-like MFS transporter
VTGPASSPQKPSAAGTSPARAGLVLGTLILAAAVANLNLTVANVALPSIGAAFTASQLQLNLIAVGYSLGLAASVLWFGALGDRYGRKRMIVLGLSAAIPASLVAGLAAGWGVLFVARLFGGLSAGLTYPTTLALITVLWSGPARTRAIALWSALGTGSAVVGPLLAGVLLQFFDWGSVFLVTIPLAALGVWLAVRYIPSRLPGSEQPVDNLGGVLSVLMIGALVVALNIVAAPDMLGLALGLAAGALLLAVAFVIRQRRAPNPLYDLAVAARPTFWVAAVAGIIIFGSLMGVLFVNQQYLQNVLGYGSVAAGAAIVPAVVMMVILAPYSARMVDRWGSRTTLLAGQSFLALSFVAMLLFWGADTAYLLVAVPLVLMGAGVGLAQTPSAHSLTGSVPIQRVGMASGTADLQRDLGGALMTSIFGALLTAGYASAMGSAISASGQDVTADTQNQLQMSYASAASIADSAPQYADQILAAARSSFLDGDQLAYIAGFVAIAIGMSLVFFFFPRHHDEQRRIAQYRKEDQDAG